MGHQANSTTHLLTLGVERIDFEELGQAPLPWAHKPTHKSCRDHKLSQFRSAIHRVLDPRRWWLIPRESWCVIDIWQFQRAVEARAGLPPRFDRSGTI